MKRPYQIAKVESLGNRLYSLDLSIDYHPEREEMEKRFFKAVTPIASLICSESMSFSFLKEGGEEWMSEVPKNDITASSEIVLQGRWMIIDRACCLKRKQAWMTLNPTLTPEKRDSMSDQDLMNYLLERHKLWEQWKSKKDLELKTIVVNCKVKAYGDGKAEINQRCKDIWD